MKNIKKTAKLIKTFSAAIIFALLLTFVTATAVSAADNKTYTAVPSPQIVIVDGEVVEFEAYNINGYNYFKLRDMAYIFMGTECQFNIEYYENVKIIELSIYDRGESANIYEPNGSEMSPKAVSNKKAVRTDVIVSDGVLEVTDGYNIDGNNYYKITDLGLLIRFGVKYDSTKNAVVVSTKKINFVYAKDYYTTNESDEYWASIKTAEIGSALVAEVTMSGHVWDMKTADEDHPYVGVYGKSFFLDEPDREYSLYSTGERYSLNRPVGYNGIELDNLWTGFKDLQFYTGVNDKNSIVTKYAVGRGEYKEIAGYALSFELSDKITNQLNADRRANGEIEFTIAKDYVFKGGINTIGYDLQERGGVKGSMPKFGGGYQGIIAHGNVTSHKTTDSLVSVLVKRIQSGKGFGEDHENISCFVMILPNGQIYAYGRWW